MSSKNMTIQRLAQKVGIKVTIPLCLILILNTISFFSCFGLYYIIEPKYHDYLDLSISLGTFRLMTALFLSWGSHTFFVTILSPLSGAFTAFVVYRLITEGNLTNLIISLVITSLIGQLAMLPFEILTICDKKNICEHENQWEALRTDEKQ